MQRKPGSGGRRKIVTGGGGNAYRRGSGIGSGPVGKADGYSGRGEPSGGSGGERGSGERSGLGTLLGLGAAAVAANAMSGNNNNGGGKKKKGGFSRLLTIVVLILVAYWLLKSCNATPAAGNEFEALAQPQSTTSGQQIETPDYATDLEGNVTGPASAVPTPAAPAASADTSVSNKARDKYTVLKGGGQDVVTLMVYLCGTDLESNYGMGTNDLNEILHADIDKNVNIIVETGGAKSWRNSVISNKTNQIYRLQDDGIVPLEKDLGKKCMTQADTLTEFIQYCTKNYPANRYGLILWDHGGGSLSGYGYDQFYANRTMALDQLDKALTQAGCKFDFIGFDACLMATYETAMVAEKHADYLIASEETEPGCGWYYTNWVSALSQNPSISTVQLGKKIIDDFVSASAKEAPGSATTLSIVDLAEMAGTVPQAFNNFAKNTTALLDSENYKQVSDARSDAREFAQSSNINQIDLVNLCDKIGTDAAADLASALRGCIKYSRYSKGMSGSNGLSIYFPYGKLSSVNTALSLYDNIGMDANYTDCIRSFASLAAGGQIASGNSSSPLTTLLGGDSAYSDLLGSLLGAGGTSTSGSAAGGGGSGYGDLLGGLLGAGSSTGGGSASGGYSGSDILTSVLGSYLSGNTVSSAGSNSNYGNYSSNSSSYGGGYSDILSALLGGSDAVSWLDTDRLQRSASFYDDNLLSPSRLVATRKNGGNVLQLTDAEWDLIQNVELNVFLDDGKGYIDLGMDNTYAWDDDGDLIMDYDRTWLAINGQVVSYYLVDNTENEDGSYVITGRVPALLNGERVELMLRFTDDDPNGALTGAKLIYDAAVTDTQAKGLVAIQPGDKIDFLCDYYTYEGLYQDSYMLGERMTATDRWQISNVSIGEGAAKVSYCLSDIYNNKYWTQSLAY